LALSNRLQLLFEHNYEDNQVSRVQALLLLTYWNDVPDREKDTWYWMGISLSLAKAIGLHRDLENLDGDIRQRRLRKLIWWSCFMRDQLIALGMRKAPRISIDDFDVPMLALEDFDIIKEASASAQALEYCHLLQSSKHQAQIASMCIANAKLCVFIGRVLSSQHSAHPLSQSMRLVPKMTTAESVEVSGCDQELQKWLDELPDEARYPDPANARAAGVDSVTYLHCALLKMTFLAIMITLHRPQAFSVALETTDIALDLQDLSMNKVLDPAAELADITNDVHEQDLSGFLPTSGVTVLVPAIVVHLLCARSRDAVTRRTNLRRFYQGMDVLRRLGEMYISADVAVLYLEAAARKAQIPIVKASLPPLLPTETAPNLAPTKTSSARHGSLSPPFKGIAHTLVSNIMLSSNESCMLLNLSMSPPVTPPPSTQSNQAKNPPSEWAALLDHACEDGTSSEFDYWMGFNLDADMSVREMTRMRMVKVMKGLSLTSI
jgi:hypothetical protein